MKKRVSIMLAAALCMSVFAGCSSQSAAPSGSTEPAKEEQKAEASTDGQKAEKAEQGEKSAVWPTDSVQLIVASTAGGFADTHARLVAQYLQESTGVPFAVVNQADGGGIVAYDTVKNAAPDGKTLLFYHSNFALACTTNVYEADPIADFTTIAQLETGGSQVMVVSAKSPYETLDDFINAAIEKPGELSLAYRLAAHPSLWAHY